MRKIADIMVAGVAVIHVAFMVIQMFFWDHALGERIFQLPRDVLHSSAALAANQGLSNGILAAGLLWALYTADRERKLFFLGAIVVAGIFGAFTAKFSILFTQALPAFIALVLVLRTSPKLPALLKPRTA